MEFTKSKSDKIAIAEGTVLSEEVVIVTGKYNAKLGTIEQDVNGVPLFKAASNTFYFRIDDLFEIAFAMAAMSPENDITVNE